MNLDRLYQILAETTVQMRKGEIVHGTPALVEAIKAGADELPGGVVSIDMMPPAQDCPPDLVPVDLHFLVVAVDREKAEARKADLVEILDHWPDPDTLAQGPSYIAVGAEVGDQGAAFQLFALGKVLGLWDIITPATFHATGADADGLAGAGYIMISGYRRGGGE